MKSAFLLLALLIGAHTFHTKKKANSKNHQDITSIAILRATAIVCKNADESFEEPTPLNPQTLAKACKKDSAKSNLEKGIKIISDHNVNTESRHRFTPKYHFHSEKFLDGKNVIIRGIDDIKAHMTNQKFEDARKVLGTIMHTLQDFYSHSNWIELENTEPCTALINAEESIPNFADEKTETCDNNAPNTNTGATFKPDILENKILTSGYFGKIKKPAGKCSHGGSSDLTTGFKKSWNGINKDAVDSSHGSLHNKAADVAIAATVQLLEKIWNNDDASYFRLVGLNSEKLKG